jgi:hypothetical protein
MGDINGIAFETSCDGAWDCGFRVLRSEGELYVIGGPLMRDYDTISYSASIDDKEIRDALFEGGGIMHRQFLNRLFGTT